MNQYINNTNWELYGNRNRRNRIQNTISETLSDIGIKDLPSVEGTLIRLASSEEDRIQGITAQALARWRNYEKDDQLLKTLESWQNETKYQEAINEIFSSQKSDGKQSPLSFIRATVAITIGYASFYDKPNQLNEKFIKLFEKLIDEENPLVRDRFKNFTIPLFLENHLIQVKEQIFSLIKYGVFHRAIAYGIANAYERSPEEVLEIINELLIYSKENQHDISSGNKKSYRDYVVIVIILALSEIKYKDEASFNADDAYEIISRLQKEEFHNPINKYYYYFVEKQLKKNKSSIKPAILSVIENLSFSARAKLTNLLTGLYVKQRKAIQLQADGIVKIGGKYKLSGKGVTIPKTEIETILMGWIPVDNQTGQEIAIESFYNYAKIIELPEKKKRALNNLKSREKKSSNTLRLRGTREKNVKTAAPNFWSMILSQVTLGKYDLRIKKLIKNMLPIMVVKNMTDREVLSIVANKMRDNKNPKIKSIGGYISDFPNHLSKIKMLGIGIAIFILFLIFAF